MAIEAKIIADSINSAGNRLTTVQYRAPRFILAEVKTHRAIARAEETVVIEDDISINQCNDLSRNARSSRAVPTARLLEEVRTDPFVPVVWTRNRPGMGEGAEIITGSDAEALTWNWLKGRDEALRRADQMMAYNPHKQVINRLLEPWMWVDGLLSATEWSNFFALRVHPAAEPHMRLLAEAIERAIGASVPAPLIEGEWHLPYIDDDDWEDVRALGGLHALKLISAARCARVSYRPFDGDDADPARDLARGQEMAAQRPIHASPFEHSGTPDPVGSGNFRGWRQLRHDIEGHHHG